MYKKKIQVALLSLALLSGGMQTVWAATSSMNMKNADINALITTVSELTGKNFIIDPRVKGKVTVITNKSLSKKQIYQVFLAILDVHGFTAVPTGDVIKILPDADAKHTGTPDTGEGQEVVTQVIEIKHVAAAQLVPILRPLVPPQGHLAAHAQTNMLIISDRVSNINRLMRIIEKVDEPSGSDIEVIQLEHASSSEVVRVLTSLKQKNRGKKDGGQESVTFVADERTNSILLSGEKSERMQIKAIIAHLDTPSGTVGNTHVVYLRYAKAKELVAVLTGVGQVKAKDAKKGKTTASNKDFDIQADESSNALVITAPPDIFRSLESVIRKLDVRRAQVLVEAIIAEVGTGKTNQLGVQWFAGGDNPGRRPVGVGSFGNSGIAGVAQGVATAGATGGAAAALGLIGDGINLAIGQLSQDGYSYGAIINALSSDNSTNLLSTPNIVTMDNEEAEIFVGKEVSVPTGSFTQTGGNATNPFTTFKPKQVGIRLKVKPQINEGDAIKLEIDSAIDDISAGTGADLVTSQRTIKTSVMVNDGQIIVLGGLISDQNSDTADRIPILGDIPLIGMLFRFKQKIKSKTNLLVFLRPKILRDAAVTTNLSNSKYSYMRGKQLDAIKGPGLFRRDDPPLLPDPKDLENNGMFNNSGLPLNLPLDIQNALGQTGTAQAGKSIGKENKPAWEESNKEDTSYVDAILNDEEF